MTVGERKVWYSPITGIGVMWSVELSAEEIQELKNGRDPLTVRPEKILRFPIPGAKA